MPTVFLYTSSPLAITTPILYRLKFLPRNLLSVKKPTQMQKTQYPDLFVIYREGFNMRTGHKNPNVVDEDLSFSQQPTS